jgi:hypothetical protein
VKRGKTELKGVLCKKYSPLCAGCENYLNTGTGPLDERVFVYQT